MNLITVNILQQKSACLEAINWLNEKFPDGMPVTVKNISSMPNRSWVKWGALNLLSAPAEKAYDEATAPAEKAYNEAIAAARKAYDEATAVAFVKAWEMEASDES